jgi:uncharacterized membrane protein YgcG
MLKHCWGGAPAQLPIELTWKPHLLSADPTAGLAAVLCSLHLLAVRRKRPLVSLHGCSSSCSCRLLLIEYQHCNSSTSLLSPLPASSIPTPLPSCPCLPPSCRSRDCPGGGGYGGGGGGGYGGGGAGGGYGGGGGGGKTGTCFKVRASWRCALFVGLAF